jgi:hypothetical protein
MTEVSFMKVRTPQALKMLTDCMNKGYDNLIRIREEFYKNPPGAENRKADWNRLYILWLQQTILTLEKIYDEPSRVHNFREKKYEHLPFSGDTLLTLFERAFDDKIQILKGYYDFIMYRAPITINNSGTMNFNNQVGDNNINEQS